jgi:prefoldin subunit 5
MSEPEIEKIDEESRIRKLEQKVAQIDSLIKWGSAVVSFVVIIAGIFGFNAWTSISAKIDELNKNAEKVEDRYTELNNQMLLAGQSNIKLNTQLTDFSTLISKKHEEQLQRFTELNKISSKALLDSERAMHNAGMLIDAVKAAQASADRSEATNKRINEQIQKIESYVKSINASFVAIQQTQTNLESYIATNIKKIHSIDKFKISVSSHYGVFAVIEGDGIPFDKQYAGFEVTGYIIIPKNCNAIIDDSGFENTFWVSDKVKARVDIVGDGKYRRVRSGEHSFK